MTMLIICDPVAEDRINFSLASRSESFARWTYFIVVVIRLVPNQFLDECRIYPGFQQIGYKRMPEIVKPVLRIADLHSGEFLIRAYDHRYGFISEISVYYGISLKQALNIKALPA